MIDSLDRLIRGWETKKQSVVVEGVPPSLNSLVSSKIDSGDLSESSIYTVERRW